MIIGVPKEIKDQEYRVSLPPGGASSLVHAGHQVIVQRGAGIGSGFEDAHYAEVDAQLVDTPDEIFAQAEMVLKVKEPLPQEYGLLRPEQMLFTYLHLAANRELTDALMESGVTAIGYETVQHANGSLPLLTPMSEVAGRMIVQLGAHYLEGTHGGRGVLLGGVPGVRPGVVVIIGGGVVGTNAAQVALGLGAQVTVIDINLDRLRYLDQVLGGNLTTIASNRYNIADTVMRADLLVGAVLVPGAKAPTLVSKDLIALMQPGAVVLDVAVDQGGCIETVHPTSHTNPTYTVHDVVHYAVPNIPGAVPRTSTYALSNATLPYVLKLANKGLRATMSEDMALRKGLNIYQGQITCQAVAEAFGLEHVSAKDRLYP